MSFSFLLFFPSLFPLILFGIRIDWGGEGRGGEEDGMAVLIDGDFFFGQSCRSGRGLVRGLIRLGFEGGRDWVE